jgi:hypothetical protein
MQAELKELARFINDKTLLSSLDPGRIDFFELFKKCDMVCKQRFLDY